ncbi:hypothetical protein ACSQ6I_06770 [Anabaena sp. WFMT]|uniref:hypothetical protein n=1 Tax=Anabaena sp. WFMT TaxID=3449730 RepID=UPI003F258901
MSQNPIIDSGTQPPNQSGLKPVLATALASLEVQLDQELTRYRRTRSGFRPPKQVGVETYMSNQPQQNGMTATLGKTQSAAEVNTNPIPQQSPSPEIDKQEEIDHFHLSSSQESSKTETPADPKSISSIVPTKVKASENQALLPAEDTSKQPDDYLESSEALLRSLTEEQPQTKKSSNSSDSLLSPLGIGSMLLLLLASLTLGYVVFNPKTLPQLNLSKLFNVTSSSNTVNTEITESNAPPTAVPEITPIPKYPNLATREFPEVKDPNDVVGLKPKVQPTPTLIPQPIAVQTPKNPVVPLTSVPPITPIPQPQSTAISPTLNEEIKPSSDGFYYVVIDNQGAGALTAARQVVPDAYLSPNQKYIYLGALKTKEEVKLRLQQLKAKGIKASVQK